MTIQTIKNGGFVAEEIQKINANFTELNDNKANASAIPTKTSELTNDSNFVNQTQLTNAVNGITVPTKTSDLTNDSNFVNTSAMNTAISNAVGAIDVPTKTSELTNDSGFVTTTTMNAGLNGKVDKVDGKGLSTNDYTTAEKNKLAGLSAPTQIAIATSAWSNGTFTIAANGKKPVVVMRKNGSNYGVALVDVQLVGTNIVVTADEAFEGYIVAV